MELTDTEQMIIESYQRILLHLSQVHADRFNRYNGDVIRASATLALAATVVQVARETTKGKH
jgi:hypothetical protein